MYFLENLLKRTATQVSCISLLVTNLWDKCPSSAHLYLQCCLTSPKQSAYESKKECFKSCGIYWLGPKQQIAVNCLQIQCLHNYRLSSEEKISGNSAELVSWGSGSLTEFSLKSDALFPPNWVDLFSPHPTRITDLICSLLFLPRLSLILLWASTPQHLLPSAKVGHPCHLVWI